MKYELKPIPTVEATGVFPILDTLVVDLPTCEEKDIERRIQEIMTEGMFVRVRNSTEFVKEDIGHLYIKPESMAGVLTVKIKN